MVIEGLSDSQKRLRSGNPHCFVYGGNSCQARALKVLVEP